jgi:hypothetical protein
MSDFMQDRNLEFAPGDGVINPDRFVWEIAEP